MPFEQSHYEDQTFKNHTLQNEKVEGIIFEGCNFVDCNFSDTVFQACEFKDCIFENCDLSLIQVKHSVFRGVVFRKSRLIGINWALVRWPAGNRLTLAQPLAFESCVLNLSNFYGLTLKKLKLENCIAHEVDFSNANLKEADFGGTDLEKSLFMHTNLEGVNFIGAKNYAISPTENMIKGAKFSMPEALNLLYGLEIKLVD